MLTSRLQARVQEQLSEAGIVSCEELLPEGVEPFRKKHGRPAILDALRARLHISGGLLLAAVACDAGSEPAPGPVPVVAGPPTRVANLDAEEAEAEAGPPLEDQPSEATSPPPTKLGKAERRKVRASIAEGRRLSRAKKLEEALEAFEAALAINPGSSTAACEAGFAALRLERLEAAQRHLQTGVASARDDAKEATCLYNLGLVAEKRGNTQAAAVYFKDSLKLRDNPQARKRLARVKPGATCVRPERVLDFEKVQCGLPDDYWYCGKDEEGNSLLGEYNVWAKALSDPEQLATGGRLRVLRSDFNLDTRARFDLLLERSGKFYVLAELGWELFTDIDAHIEAVTYRHVDLARGGDPEVLVEVRSYVDDSMANHRFYACEAKHPDPGDEFDACWEKAQRDGAPRREQTLFVCGDIDGGWSCAQVEREPKDAQAFTAAFRCAP